jgi:hypothetical protein
MRHFRTGYTFLLLLALVVILGSCITSNDTATPSSRPTPTSTPTTPSPTPEFTWLADPGIRLEDAISCYICRLADGRFRMYYTGDGGILSAISGDGMTFQKEAGIRVSAGSVDGPMMIVGDPSVVTLKDGRIRMYYKGASGSGGPGHSVQSIYSAISADGLNFVGEGIRIDATKTQDNGWASVPEAITLPDDRVRIYYVSANQDPLAEHITSAISSDGLNFTPEDTRLPGFVDPAIVRLDDGRYLLLANAFPEGDSGTASSGGIQLGSIYSFVSDDGIHFTDRELVVPAEQGENYCDPAIVEIDKGVYRVYYWNAGNAGKPEIMSTTGKQTT